MCVTLCGRFGPDEGGVAGYVDRIGTKYAAKWGVQMVGMNFQTHPSFSYLKIPFFLGFSDSDEAVPSMASSNLRSASF
ncbi:DUF6783 domain-containing protein [Enterocloster lavalensis]|uniref:DUF6783 domain-containing protein n=1 Tax=Enterocloster lavalensis TaxID=460384 RepID=UPI0027DF2D96|nr:DUF6783 domain-containing protein [Enterocloster lavalensis]